MIIPQLPGCLLWLQDLPSCLALPCLILPCLVAKSSYFVMLANDRSASCILGIRDSSFDTPVQHARSCYAKVLEASRPRILPLVVFFLLNLHFLLYFHCFSFSLDGKADGIYLRVRFHFLFHLTHGNMDSSFFFWVFECIIKG